MITITKEKFVPFAKVASSDSCIFYPDIFTGKIIESIKGTQKSVENGIKSLLTGLNVLTEKTFKEKQEKDLSNFGTHAYIIEEKTTMRFSDGKRTEKIHVVPGSLIIMGSGFRNEWNFNTPKCFEFVLANFLPNIFLNISERLEYRKLIRKLTASQNSNCLRKFMNEKNMLGSGCYGNVFRAEISDNFFAVKFSKIKPDAKDYLFSKDFSSWHEVFILENIVNNIVSKNICPNLPILYDKFFCKKCTLVFDEKKEKTPCVVSIIELASGNLKDWTLSKHTREEYESCLFQVMAAIHAIQIHGQIMNFDVKKENVLVYNVKPGGYWHYVIHGKDFYVPNFGKMFVLNDFGISRSMSPKFCMYRNKKSKTFRLGHRFAVIYNGEFIPLEAEYEYDDDIKKVKPEKILWKTQEGDIKTRGAEFRMERSCEKILSIPVKIPRRVVDFLNTKKIGKPSEKSFFMFPEIIPPFEFFNDTQDGIRMLIGGKRTTQNGKHSNIRGLDSNFVESLQKYKSKLETMKKDLVFSENPSKVVAGYFLERYFSENTTFHQRIPRKEEIIGKYVISTKNDV